MPVEFLSFTASATLRLARDVLSTPTAEVLRQLPEAATAAVVLAVVLAGILSFKPPGTCRSRAAPLTYSVEMVETLWQLEDPPIMPLVVVVVAAVM
jgi:hypothetical protein